MSEVFCGTIEIQDYKFNTIKEDTQGIKLYKIKLSIFQEFASNLMNFLTPIEYNRANSYHFKKDKNKFIICRSLLKFILAEVTGLDVDKIILNNHVNQKPYLPSHPSVFFNVSYASDYAIIAIAKYSIGVDIEYVNKKFDFDDILPNFYNRPEIDEILNSNCKHRAFYRLWTRKEAIVKATGNGIDDDITEIVSLNGYHNMRQKLLGDFKSLKVYSFEFHKNYIGAIAFSKISDHITKLFFYPLPYAIQEFLNDK